jgi:predicted PurR-regulated permease PerM
MDDSERQFARRVGIVLALVLLALAVVALLVFAFQFFLVVFAGTLLAVLLDGLTGQVTKYTGMPRKLALLLVVLLLLGVGVGFWWIVGPQVVDQVDQLGEKIPEGLDAVEDWLRQFGWGATLLDETPDPAEVMGADGTVGSITGVFTTAFGVVFNFFIIIFIGLYGAIRPDLYVQNVLFLVPHGKRQRGRELLSDLGRALRRWFFGQFLAMIFVGVTVTIGLSIIGVPLALALGLLSGLLEFVPYLGPIAASVPIILIALIDDPMTAVWAAGFLFVVQQTESYVITPMAQQFAVSMPPALLIIGQVLFGLVGGFIGVILATPLLVAVVVTIQKLYVQGVIGDDVKPLGERGQDHVETHIPGED